MPTGSPIRVGPRCSGISVKRFTKRQENMSESAAATGRSELRPTTCPRTHTRAFHARALVFGAWMFVGDLEAGGNLVLPSLRSPFSS